jgi:feruloyl esterase
MGLYRTGSQPAQFPIPVPNKQGLLPYYGNGFARYFVARDPNFNPLQFQLANFASRSREISALMDSTDPDLSTFLAHAGKLILKVNGADYAPSPFQGINYYKSVVATMGQAQVDSLIRFYVAPGANHNGQIVSGTTGEAMPSFVDLLAVLDGWVESGNAPETLTLVGQEKQPPFNVTASRPMCRYPLYPRYDGRSDPKQSASFICTKQ